MVVLVCKGPDSVEFCYETRLGATVAETLLQLADLHNLALLLRQLAAAAAAQAHACSEESGADGHSPDQCTSAAEQQVPPSEDTCACVLTLLESLICKVGSTQPITKSELLGGLDAVQGALLAAFPAGLEAAHPLRATVDSMYAGGEDAKTQCGNSGLDPSTTKLWFGSKAMQPTKKLGEYLLGANEKTRAVVKLQPSGAGAPLREPVLDRETEQAMMAWYYKKQEEQQRIAAEDVYSTVTPTWANSNSLKQHFVGMPSVRLR